MRGHKHTHELVACRQQQSSALTTAEPKAARLSISRQVEKLVASHKAWQDTLSTYSDYFIRY